MFDPISDPLRYRFGVVSGSGFAGEVWACATAANNAKTSGEWFICSFQREDQPAGILYG